MYHKFSKSGFIKFLESVGPRKSVGDPNDSNDCPLCRYLKQQGAFYVSMGIRSRSVNDTTVRTQNPQWAKDFQEEAIKRREGSNRRSMTAGAALKVLEWV